MAFSTSDQFSQDHITNNNRIGCKIKLYSSGVHWLRLDEMLTNQENRGKEKRYKNMENIEENEEI